jgi:hypothetical protein
VVLGFSIDLLSSPEGGGPYFIPGEPSYPYKELIFIGKIQKRFIRTTFPTNNDTFLYDSPLKQVLPLEWSNLEKKMEKKFFYNRPTVETIRKAELKMDEERPFPKMDLCKTIALGFVDRMLEVPLTQAAWTDQRTYEHIDLDKSPALPWVWQGFRTREQFIKSSMWLSNYDDIEWLSQIGWIYKSTPKEEYANIEDFNDMKARTFLIPGYHLLHWQIRLFGASNEALKNHAWSKYGFSPFMGGTDGLARTLLFKTKEGKFRFPIRIMYDIAGYDRKIDLSNVANRKYKYFCNANPENMHKYALWVCNGLKRSALVLSSGDVVIRGRGGNSGAGTTTADNIMAACEVFCDLIIFAYFQHTGCYPTYEYVAEQIVYLFGDDNLSGLDEALILLADQEFVSNRLLYFHGLKLKIFEGGYEYSFEKLRFLGFQMVPDAIGFLPKWDQSRLMLPLVYTFRTGHTHEIFVQQFYSILLLSYAHSWWPELRAMYIKYLGCLQGSGNPIIKAHIRNGAPNVDEMEFWYHGLETSACGLVDGGPKIDMIYNKLTFLYPTLSLNDGVYKCESRVMGDVMSFLTTTNSDPLIAFSLMLSKFGEVIAESWVPTIPEGIRQDMEKEIKETGIKLTDSERAKLVGIIHAHLFKGTANVTPSTPTKQVRPGSFNAYGNGQPNIVTAYLAEVFDCDEDFIFEMFNTLAEADEEQNLDLQFKMYDLLVPKRQNANNSKSSEGSYNPYGNQNGKLCFVKIFGVFNPYGNGQKLTRKVFIARQVSRGVTHEAALVMWQQRQANARTRQKYSKFQSVPPKGRVRGGTQKKNPKGTIVIDQGAKKPFLTPAFSATSNKMTNYNVHNHFPECTARYLMALTDPFYVLEQNTPATKWYSSQYGSVDATAMPCIPSFPPISSFKTSAIFRGELTVGTNGTGFIAMCPNRLASDYATTANLYPPILTSTALWAGTGTFPIMDTAAVLETGVMASNWVTRFAVSDLVVNTTTLIGPKMRWVSSGLRARYTGAPLGMSGVVHVVQTPGHESLSNQNISTLQSLPSCVTYATSRDWTMVSATPVHPVEYEYEPDYSNASSIVYKEENLHYMGMVWVGLPPGVVIAVEAVTCFEVIGQNINGKTRTPVDVVGLGTVSSIISPDSINTIQESPSMIYKLAETASNTISEAAPYIGKAVGSLGYAYAQSKLFGIVPGQLSIANI